MMLIWVFLQSFASAMSHWLSMRRISMCRVCSILNGSETNCLNHLRNIMWLRASTLYTHTTQAALCPARSTMAPLSSLVKACVSVYSWVMRTWNVQREKKKTWEWIAGKAVRCCPYDCVILASNSKNKFKSVVFACLLCRVRESLCPLFCWCYQGWTVPPLPVCIFTHRVLKDVRVKQNYISCLIKDSVRINCKIWEVDSVECIKMCLHGKKKKKNNQLVFQQ